MSSRIQKRRLWVSFYLQIEIENCKLKCQKCELDLPIRLFENQIGTCGKDKKEVETTIGDYNCTICPKKRMNRAQYVKHIEDQHFEEEGVFAICSV